MDPIIRRATDEDASAVAELYLRSFKTALPTVRLVHTDDEVTSWIANHVIPAQETWVAEAPDGTLAGMLVVGDHELDQLYLAPEWQGRGLGDRFVALAKERQPRGLRLYTFQVNTRACRFYERHRFAIVDTNDGSRNEEREPDVQYEWGPGASDPRLGSR